MSRKHTADAVSEAVRWFNRFRSQDSSALSPEEATEWAAWSADDAHLREFCRVDELWQKLETLPAIMRPTKEDATADEYDPSMSIRDWLAQGDANRPRR
jgi:ferric-dicitrate binding protein FerR (iron transport regulator)